MTAMRLADDELGDERQWSIDARVDVARPGIEAIVRSLYGGPDQHASDELPPP